MATHQIRGGYRHSDAADSGPGLALSSPGQSAPPPTEPPAGLVAAAAAPVPRPLTGAALLAAVVLACRHNGRPWPTTATMEAIACRALAPAHHSLDGLNPQSFAAVLRALGASGLVMLAALVGALEAVLSRLPADWKGGAIVEQFDAARALVAPRLDVLAALAALDGDAARARRGALDVVMQNTSATDPLRWNLACAARSLGDARYFLPGVQCCVDALSGLSPDPTTEGREHARRDAEAVIARAMRDAVGIEHVHVLMRAALAEGGAL